MLAAVFEAEGRLSLEERPLPSRVQPGDVLIAVEACGICGTDLQILATPPGHPATPGTILGHEFVGRVVEAGPSAGIEPGERVVIDADPKCGVCTPCRTGRPASCLNVVALGIFRDGALASHVVAPAGSAYRIADAVPPAVASLVEPLACVVNGTRRAAARAGESVLIFGGGAIGCLFLAVFRATGCSPIVLVEPVAARAQVAREMGADAVLTPDELPAALGGWFRGGADIVVDAVGSQLAQAIDAAAMGGRIVLFGMNSNARQPIHQVDITSKSLAVLGSYISNFTFPEAVRLVESRRLAVDPMISAVVPLADGHEAFELLRSGQATKVVITP
jgi:2-desacetyl-2-hydroxyethyl bacteriochlorophyllide A dehydrogenase